MCPICLKEFDIPREGFRKPLKAFLNIINKEMFLSESEKFLKKELHHIQDKFEKDVKNFLTEAKGLQMFTHDYFTELRNQIYQHKEKLKVEIWQKIEEYSCDMIHRTKEAEKALNISFTELKIANIDFEKEKQENNEVERS